MTRMVWKVQHIRKSKRVTPKGYVFLILRNTMKIEMIRYYAEEGMAKSLVSVDGTPFCEAREAWFAIGVKDILPAGAYTCRCFASEFSPMTLKVCRSRGKGLVRFGWDALRQWKKGVICLGIADSDIPAERRVINRQKETFQAFTRKVYAAYIDGEPFTLNVEDTFL